MRLLVVDDDAVFREELSDFLGSEGHTVDSAPSAARAVERLEAGLVDVVFTDLKMPRQSGLELLEEVRRRWPATFVVVVTGYATIDTAVEAMKLGAFDYVAKPFKTDQIRQVLNLVREETVFSGPAERSRSPRELAERLADRDGVPILLVTSGTPSKSPVVETLAFDGGDLSSLRGAVEGFLARHPGAGLVVGEADRMLDGHRTGDVVDLLRVLQERAGPKGPFAVGFDPARVTRIQADALRALVAAPVVHGALEALANPIRRRVLMRLKSGPASFTDLMRASGFDDSPKISFHLRRLLDEGLISRTDHEYRLTMGGNDAVAVLRELEQAGAAKGRRSFVFSAPQPSHPARGG